MASRWVKRVDARQAPRVSKFLAIASSAALFLLWLLWCSVVIFLWVALQGAAAVGCCYRVARRLRPTSVLMP
jgi:hypothetical protein